MSDEVGYILHILTLNLSNSSFDDDTWSRFSVVIIHVENVCVGRSDLSSICVLQRSFISHHNQAACYFLLHAKHVIQILKSILFLSKNTRKWLWSCVVVVDEEMKQQARLAFVDCLKWNMCYLHSTQK